MADAGGFEVKFDLDDFLEQADAIGGALDQVPFALSRALNDAATEARRSLIDETWPDHVTVRNSGFLRWALHTEFSTKQNLVVSVEDRSGRARLKMHDEGGVKTPRGENLAIPVGAFPHGAHGIPTAQRPAFLARKVVIGNRIYQRVGTGANSRLRLMYVLKPSANQPADVPFTEDFETSMRRSAREHFPERMRQAMRTRRR